MVGLIFVFVRSCVHYALFEDEAYLQAQLSVLKDGIALFMAQREAAKQDAEVDAMGASRENAKPRLWKRALSCLNPQADVG